MKPASIDTNLTNYLTNKESMADRWAKRVVIKWLKMISAGHLTLQDGDTLYEFGEPAATANIVGHIVINHPIAYRDILFNGAVGAGEAYMRGAWQSVDLVCVIRVLCANMHIIENINKGWSSVSQYLASGIHRFWRKNSKANSRLNIAAHYDLGNDFFSLFLDPTMMYSSAIFPTVSSQQKLTLDQAAVYKLEHICQRLQLQANDHLLEIGTGWGGMAIYAAQHYGCRVTTTTISKEQYTYTLAQVKKAKLEDKITVLLDDYRDMHGQFDKLVSIEMIEAVGYRYYQQYFDACSQLLKQDGLMLLQAITVPDQRYEMTKKSTDFIQRYIFPGGELPSLSIVAENVRRFTDMQIIGVEDITLDYAKTLEQWRARFFEKIDIVKQQGFDDIFIRMWDFYLSYCEGGFRERSISTVQVLMAKPRCQQLPVIQHLSQ